MLNWFRDQNARNRSMNVVAQEARVGIQGFRPQQKGCVMDYTALLDADFVSDEFEKDRKRERPDRPKKRQHRARKGRKPNKPNGHIGQRSNRRLRNI